MSILPKRDLIRVPLRRLFCTNLLTPSQVRTVYQPREKEVRTRPKGWTSFLKSNTLGQPASILVLRDSEEKRGSGGKEDAPEPTLQQKSVKDVNVDELLASVNAQRNEAGQEEVNQSIDALRPLHLNLGEPFMLASAQYDQILQALLRGFNQLQMSRYITIHEGDRALKERKAVPNSPGPGKSDAGIVRSDWGPMDRHGLKLKAKPRTTVQGKGALAEAILRSIWGVEVREEVEQIGFLSVKLEVAKFSLLTRGGKTAHLLFRTMLTRAIHRA